MHNSLLVTPGVETQEQERKQVRRNKDRTGNIKNKDGEKGAYYYLNMVPLHCSLSLSVFLSPLSPDSRPLSPYISLPRSLYIPSLFLISQKW